MPRLQSEQRSEIALAISTSAHIEKYFGAITKGWPSAGVRGLSICLLGGAPEGLANTFTTLGLSIHILNQPSARSVRQECLLVVDASFAAMPIVALLGAIAEMAIDRHEAIIRGQVIRAGKMLASVCSKAALYAANPTIFSDDSWALATSPPTIFTWLIPITAQEEEFCDARGWSALEELLADSGLDLFDLNRVSATDVRT